MRVFLNNKLYAYAVKLLARREYSIRELYSKALAKGYAENEISVVIHKLLEFDFQSDYRYAEMIVNSKYNKCYGPNYIQYYLHQKGMSKSYFAAIIKENHYDWVAVATQIVQKRLNQVQSVDRIDEQKQIMFLQNRGFSIDHAKAAMLNVFK